MNLYWENRFVVGASKDRAKIIVWRLGDPEPHSEYTRANYDILATGLPGWADVQDDVLNLAQLLGWTHA